MLSSCLKSPGQWGWVTTQRKCQHETQLQASRAGRNWAERGPYPETPEVYGMMPKGSQSSTSTICSYQLKDAINSTADTSARHAQHGFSPEQVLVEPHFGCMAKPNLQGRQQWYCRAWILSTARERWLGFHWKIRGFAQLWAAQRVSAEPQSCLKHA